MRSKYVLVIGLLLVFVSAFASAHCYISYTSSFFSRTLAAADVQDHVVSDGTSYEVSDGIVRDSSGNIPSFPRSVRVLRLAYELELARRAPLFDLSGTDPTALESAVNKLSAAQEKLALAQRSPAEATLVRSLYPVSFLASLANLENRRQLFLTSESDVDAVMYEDALQTTIKLGQVDILDFSRAFDQAIIGKEGASFLSFGGTITTASMRSGITTILRRFDEVADERERRRACLSGHSSFCNADDLEVAMPEVSVIPVMPADAIANARDISSLLFSASMRPRIHTNALVSSSVCIKDLPQPHVLNIVKWSATSSVNQLLATSDLFFSPTLDATGPVLTYLARHNLSYSIVTTNAYYQCPETAVDASLAEAILQTVQTAAQQPDIAKDTRTILLADQDYPTEWDAINYVRAAMSEASSTASLQNRMFTLAHMFVDHSADLDYTVRQIDAVSIGDENLSQRGAPFDVSARTLFLTHSAFPSLYLADNPSAGHSHVDIRSHNEAELEKLINTYRRYSVLKRQLSRNEIVRNIQFFWNFENSGS